MKNANIFLAFKKTKLQTGVNEKYCMPCVGEQVYGEQGPKRWTETLDRNVVVSLFLVVGWISTLQPRYCDSFADDTKLTKIKNRELQEVIGGP